MKSLYQKLGEAVEKLTEAGKFKQYREASANCTTIESKVNCAEKLLAGPVRESRPPIRMHNGRSDNGGELFTESAGYLTESLDNDPYAESDAVLFKSLGISEADFRRSKGLPPAGTTLTPTQLREFRFLRGIRISESDALKGALKVA